MALVLTSPDLCGIVNGTSNVQININLLFKTSFSTIIVGINDNSTLKLKNVFLISPVRLRLYFKRTQDYAFNKFTKHLHTKMLMSVELITKTNIHFSKQLSNVGTCQIVLSDFACVIKVNTSVVSCLPIARSNSSKAFHQP